MEMLICTRCREEKPATLAAFPPHNKKRNGLDSWCRQCRATYRNEICRGRFRANGYTDEVIRKLRAVKQCMICGNGCARMAIDHDHSTGQVRGVLCMNCNQGLGKFKDDPRLLEAAQTYLLKSLQPKDR